MADDPRAAQLGRRFFFDTRFSANGEVSCATCHVIVAADWADRLPPPAADEAAMLEMTAAAREATSRLACQILLQPALDGLRVRLPDRQY